jgi:hypothetical protein
MARFMIFNEYLFQLLTTRTSCVMDATDLDALRTKEYWNLRYDKEPAGHEFDWFKTFDDLAPFLQDYIKSDNAILMLGCGNSVRLTYLQAEHVKPTK